MKFTKQQIVAGMEATGLVPLFSHDDATKSQAVLEALIRGVFVFLKSLIEKQTRLRFLNTCAKAE
jgi:hypothetical protein